MDLHEKLVEVHVKNHYTCARPRAMCGESWVRVSVWLVWVWLWVSVWVWVWMWVWVWVWVG